MGGTGLHRRAGRYKNPDRARRVLGSSATFLPRRSTKAASRRSRVEAGRRRISAAASPPAAEHPWSRLCLARSRCLCPRSDREGRKRERGREKVCVGACAGGCACGWVGADPSQSHGQQCWSVLQNIRAGERKAAVLVGLVLSLVLEPTGGLTTSSQARLQSHRSVRYSLKRGSAVCFLGFRFCLVSITEGSYGLFQLGLFLL